MLVRKSHAATYKLFRGQGGGGGLSQASFIKQQATPDVGFVSAGLYGVLREFLIDSLDCSSAITL